MEPSRLLLLFLFWKFIARIPLRVELGHELLAEWSSYLAYAVAFIYVGVIWLNHHYMFGTTRQSGLTSQLDQLGHHWNCVPDPVSHWRTGGCVPRGKSRRSKSRCRPLCRHSQSDVGRMVACLSVSISQPSAIGASTAVDYFRGANSASRHRDRPLRLRGWAWLVRSSRCRDRNFHFCRRLLRVDQPGSPRETSRRSFWRAAALSRADGSGTEPPPIASWRRDIAPRSLGSGASERLRFQEQESEFGGVCPMANSDGDDG